MAAPAITHPNRDRVESKATRAIIVMLLLVSALIVLTITVGGWAVLQGAQFVSIAYVALCVLFAVYVARWNRGVLPVAAALAVFYGVIGAVAGPAWFERDKAGFEAPAIDPGLLGLLSMLLIPVQIMLLLFALRGFAQKWNVEVAAHDDRDDFDDAGRAQPA